MERMNWMDKLIVAAILILLAVLLKPAQADEVKVPVYTHRSEALSADLYAGECVDPRVLEIIVVGMPQYLKRFKALQATFKMKDGSRKPFAGCWAEVTAEEVGVPSLFMIFEDGDYFLVEKKKFLRKMGTEV